MNAILMSIRPEWVAKILNGEKTIEIRKKFPSDFVGWVYIYCTKARPYLTRGVRGDVYPSCVSSQGIVPHHLNSRVVARFYCDNVEEIKFINPNRTCGFSCEISDDDCYYNINENECCLSQDDLYDYLQGKNGYAINISKLEIFNEPKEISEFRQWRDCGKCWHEEDCDCNLETCFMTGDKLTRAPQSWRYVVVGMKYIRTKDGIIEINPTLTNEQIDISLGENTPRADTIEELCDCYLCFTKSGKNWIVTENYETAKLYAERDCEVNACILTDKRLIYVAKMNDKGELELL